MTASFNAPKWMARFKEAGGAYVLADDHLHLWPSPGTRSHAERAETFAMVVGLSNADRQQLAEHLNSAKMVEG
jgi:hypothetical protein